MEPLVSFRSVTKSYGRITALKNVNLNVNGREILAVVGPNGSGKTTLLRIMAAIEAPTSGEFYFKGVKVGEKNAREVRLKTTMVFQRTILLRTSVYKNVAYGLKLRKIPKKEIDKEVRGALKLVGLEGYEKRPAKSLSGGEQQRVSLARATALGTELLLLDEPMANLDPKSTSIIEEAVSQVNRERGSAVVVATHSMFRIKALAHRVALLIKGKMMKVGEADEILKIPSKDLASLTLENVFSGEAEMLEGGGSLVNIGNDVKIETAFNGSGKVLVYIRPDEIIVSNKPLISSARNVLSGKVTEILDLGSTVKLKVEAGRKFTVQITRRSFIEMGLNIGSKVYLTFKASSVRLI
ncbi:TPA: ABC transporter ATP-binding protein [Candidatus Bathyarchaeota archaeon]|nr:ABC transporter ATP-binding protein [Candidatus Bathyarchaeota archaeon]